jgi:hypothetical protein
MAAVSIETVNTYAAKWTIGGWFAGLAYYNWFSSTAAHVPLWAHFLLVTVGMFAVSIVIGGGMALVAAYVTKACHGQCRGQSACILLGGFHLARHRFLCSEDNAATRRVALGNCSRCPTT